MQEQEEEEEEEEETVLLDDLCVDADWLFSGLGRECNDGHINHWLVMNE